ncbi:hypothetical protein ACH5RR_029811 [Cinchona calisaya]|uniref:Uncharacterized protein n=1 Tax=Cinchona calisaya TaxID=153742 RepID=A0ABD2YSQ6_9GENT
MAEMVAARRAIEFGAELGINGFYLERDALGIIKQLKLSDDDLSTIAPIADDKEFGLIIPKSKTLTRLAGKGIDWLILFLNLLNYVMNQRGQCCTVESGHVRRRSRVVREQRGVMVGEEEACGGAEGVMAVGRTARGISEGRHVVVVGLQNK